MGDLATYDLVHFLPFSLETYIRLFERVNEELFPVQALGWGLSLVLIVSLLRGWRIGQAVAVGIGSAACGIGFFGFYYSELVWAGPYIAATFVFQGAVCSFLLARVDPEPRPVMASLVALTLLFVSSWPVLSGLGWAAAETFGVTPDLTAVTCLAVAGVAGLRGFVAAVVPLGWLVVSAATWWALGDPGGLVVPAVGVLVFGLSTWRGVAENRSGA